MTSSRPQGRLIKNQGWFVATISGLAAGDPRWMSDFNDFRLGKILQSLSDLQNLKVARVSRKGWQTLEHQALGQLQWRTGIHRIQGGSWAEVRLNGLPLLSARASEGGRMVPVYRVDVHPALAEMVESHLGVITREGVTPGGPSTWGEGSLSAIEAAVQAAERLAATAAVKDAGLLSEARAVRTLLRVPLRYGDDLSMPLSLQGDNGALAGVLARWAGVRGMGPHGMCDELTVWSTGGLEVPQDTSSDGAILLGRTQGFDRVTVQFGALQDGQFVLVRRQDSGEALVLVGGGGGGGRLAEVTPRRCGPRAVEPSADGFAIKVAHCLLVGGMPSTFRGVATFGQRTPLDLERVLRALEADRVGMNPGTAVRYSFPGGGDATIVREHGEAPRLTVTLPSPGDDRGLQKAAILTLAAAWVMGQEAQSLGLKNQAARRGTGVLVSWMLASYANIQVHTAARNHVRGVESLAWHAASRRVPKNLGHDDLVEARSVGIQKLLREWWGAFMLVRGLSRGALLVLEGGHISESLIERTSAELKKLGVEVFGA